MKFRLANGSFEEVNVTIDGSNDVSDVIIEAGKSEGFGSWLYKKYNDAMYSFFKKPIDVGNEAVENWFNTKFMNYYDSIYVLIPEMAGFLTVAAGIMLMIPFANRGKVIAIYCTGLFALIIWKAFGGVDV